MNGKVAKMQVGGKTAGSVFVRMVPIFRIAGEPIFKKPSPERLACTGSAALPGRMDRMVKGQLGQEFRIFEVMDRSFGPASGYGRRQRRERREFDPGKWIFSGKFR